ncbi:MAG: glutathione S-transferase [Rhodospirillaceae bacterium]|nr:glutathione S-transferase [Rhodospirillaceae bacterium]
MITLYSKATSNGRKASIMLEEVGLEYVVRAMALDKKEQKENWYLQINPNGRIPCIVDDQGPNGDPVTIFESGAILIYLAEKAGQLLPLDPVARFEVLNWLFFASGHVTHTGLAVMWQVRSRERGEEHSNLKLWQAENARVYSVLERGLEGRKYFSVDYSIADIAAWPWIYRHQLAGISLDKFPNLKNWFERIADRPAVQRGLQVPPRNDAF